MTEKIEIIVVREIDLGMRAAACMDWRWMEGMQACALPTMDPIRLTGRDASQAWVIFYDKKIARLKPKGIVDCIPDVNDAATIGCLLELAREAHDDPCLCTYYRGPEETAHPGWGVSSTAGGMGDIHGIETEAEALVMALELAHFNARGCFPALGVDDVLHCGSCGAIYPPTEAVPDPDPEGFPMGADKCSKCGVEGCMGSGREER
jgi:hypothetical protein